MSTATTPAVPAAPLPEIIPPERFGAFINIPSVFNQNRTSTLNAKTAYQKRMLAICEPDPASPGKFIFMDITKVDATKYEELIAPLGKLRTNLKLTEERQKSLRKPFTDDFATILSAFTAEEKSALAMADKIKDIENAWEKEKLRRANAAKKVQTNAIAKAQEAIVAAAAFKTHINTQIAAELLAVISKLAAAFNKQSLESFESYQVKLKTYTPTLDDATWHRICSGCSFLWQLHLPTEAGPIYDNTIADAKPGAVTHWAARLTAERDRLIELIDSRKNELKELAAGTTTIEAVNTRIAEETKATYTQVTQQAIADNVKATQNADVQKVTASFEVASAGLGSVTPAMKKGTQVKKKYKCTTHIAFVAIMQSWAVNDMPGLTIDELNTKLSFMRTACNTRLAAGEELKADGLEVEEDVSTRTTKPAK